MLSFVRDGRRADPLSDYCGVTCNQRRIQVWLGGRMEALVAEAPRSSAKGASRVERRRRKDREDRRSAVPPPQNFSIFKLQKAIFGQ